MGMTWTERDLPSSYTFAWLKISVSDDGQSIMIPQYFDDNYISTDGGTTWRNATPNPESLGFYWNEQKFYWVCGAVSGDGQVFIIGSDYVIEDKNDDPLPQLYISKDAGVTWLPLQPNAEEGYNEQFWSLCTDQDGSHILVGSVYSDRTWLSTDSGDSWTELFRDGVSFYTDLCCMNSTGAILYVTNGPRIYKSIDSGVNWSELQPAGNVNGLWTICSCSSDGQTVLVADGDTADRMYLSVNGGSSWTKQTVTGEAMVGWSLGGMSRNGQVLWASQVNDLFVSYNGGGSWAKISELAAAECTVMGFDSDGSIRLAASGYYTSGGTGRVYQFDGATWNEIRPHAPSFDRFWPEGGSASDSTGQTRLVCCNRVYLSHDYGYTWTEVNLVGDIEADWKITAMSADGLTMVAAASWQNYFYISTDGGQTWANHPPVVASHGYYKGVTLSSDGSVIYTTTSASKVYGVYKSTNSGGSWSKVSPVAFNSYQTISCSADGSVVVVYLGSTGLYLSTNSGTNWTRISTDWSDLSMGPSVSSDGQSILYYDLYTHTFKLSHDQGATWGGLSLGNTSGLSPDRFRVSADFQVMILFMVDISTLYMNNIIRVSTDGGATWSTDSNPEGTTGRAYFLLDLSEDGQYFLAAESWGRLYTGELTQNGPPDKPINPTPVDHATRIAPPTSVTWEEGGGLYPATSFDVWIGPAVDEMVKVSTAQVGLSYTPAVPFQTATAYFWRIDASNAYGTTTGDIWIFFVSPQAPFLLTYPPKWPVVETLTWNTAVLKGMDGSQQRIARKNPPGQAFNYTVLCQTESDTETCLALLHTALKYQWHIPVWPEADWYTGPLSAGVTSINIDTTYADYRNGGEAVIYYSPTKAEVVTTSTVAAGGLTLATGLLYAYPAGAMVMPCRTGYLQDVCTRKRTDGGGSDIQLVYRVLDTAAVTGYTASLTYDGYEVLTLPSRIIDEEFQEAYDPDFTVIDASVGTFKSVSVSDFNIVLWPYIFEHTNKAMAWNFRQWLHSVAGRQKAFLAPTYRPDFVLTRAVDSGDVDVYVYISNAGRAQYMGVNALETYLAFMPTGGTLIPRKITSMGMISEEEEKLRLDAAPGQPFSAGDSLCWLHRCTLAGDDVEIQWLEHDHNICETSLMRVSQ